MTDMKKSFQAGYKILFSCIVTVLFFFIFILGASIESYAQNPVEILEADLIEGGTIEGQKVRKILGNVFIKSVEEDLEMYCDSAYQFVESSEIRAFGNIQINTENEKIWADSLVYFTDIDFSQLRGRVIIEADSTILFGNSVDYRFSTRVAHFIDEIRLEDTEGILTANSGFYYREADSAVFRGQVQLQDSTQYIEGDSLFSNRGKKYYEMHSNIFADDAENNSMLKGSYLEADSTGRRLLTGNAWLQNIKTDTTEAAEQDTLQTSPQEGIAETFRPDSISYRPDSLINQQTDKPVQETTVDTADTVEETIETETQPPGLSRQEITHTVNPSETLFSIARLYGVRISDVKEWNNLGTDDLRVGQNLDIRLPAGTGVINHTVEDQETLFSISSQYDVEIEEIKSWNNLQENTIRPQQVLVLYIPENITYYTVQAGDNLFSISQKFNTTVAELRELNNLSTDAITVGEQLIVGKGESETPVIEDVARPVRTDSTFRQPSAPFSAVADSNTSATDTDTTHIRARRILSIQEKTLTDTTTIVNAYENVRIWSPNFSAVSDTSRYNESAETFELWSQAKAWNEEVQLSGPYIKVLLNEGEVELLKAYPNPFSVQEDTVISRLNQIKGDTLNAYFKEGTLSMIHVFGSSHLLRFTKNEQDQADGAVELTAPSTRIFFEEGELTELKSEGNIDGSYLPETEETANRQLDGFIWTPELRPQRPEGQMERRFPPIPMERPFELPQRYLEHIETNLEDN